jgi:hypothetical protein
LQTGGRKRFVLVKANWNGQKNSKTGGSLLRDSVMTSMLAEHLNSFWKTLSMDPISLPTSPNSVSQEGKEKSLVSSKPAPGIAVFA